MNEIFVKTSKTNEKDSKTYEPTAEEMESRRQARKLEQENNPHYLKHSDKVQKKIKFYDEDYDNIPIAELDIPVSLKIEDPIVSGKSYQDGKSENFKYKRQKKISKKKRSKRGNSTR